MAKRGAMVVDYLPGQGTFPGAAHPNQGNDLREIQIILHPADNGTADTFLVERSIPMGILVNYQLLKHDDLALTTQH